ncbi:MAG: Rieske (2Fe-2S) protein [Steroidobacteraceae bacterium]
MTARPELDTERVLCALAELDEHGSRGFTVGGGDWPLRGFVVRLADGSVRGWLDRCPHAGHPLALRPHRYLTPDRTLIICSSHGALFEREGGLCLAGPCAGKSLTPVPVEVVAGYVLLAPGVDPAAREFDLSR